MCKEEILHKELDLIQEVIKRMASNSFQIKAWLIGILTAVIAFSKDSVLVHLDNQASAFLINVFLLLPIICFWYLDAFFLKTEKLYREVYKWVIANRDLTDAYMYDLNTFKRKVGEEEIDLTKSVGNTKKIMCSDTLLPFYIIPTVLVVGLLLYNIYLLLSK